MVYEKTTLTKETTPQRETNDTQGGGSFSTSPLGLAIPFRWLLLCTPVTET